MPDLKPFALCLPLVITSSTALALDTTEAFEPGASDVELYLDVGGIGAEGPDRSLGTELVLGYGLLAASRA